MADISKIKTPNNIEYNVKDAALTTEITNARGNYVNLDARLDNYDEVIGDIDTALSSLLVDLVPKTITENGTYDPADDNADGYSEVTVNVITGGHEVVVTTIPNATVTLSKTGTTYTSTANSNGIASFLGVTSGTYTVQVSIMINDFTAVSDTTTITVSTYEATEDNFASLTITASDNCNITITDGTTTKTVAYLVGSSITQYVSINTTWDISTTINDTLITRTVSVNSYENQNISLTPTQTYGVSWGFNGKALTRTDDAASFSDPVPYVNGMTASQCSSPFDDLMPWSGMTKSTDENGNVLVAIPKFWYKIEKTNQALTIKIADGPVDGFYVSPAHRARGSSDFDRDVVYIGRYHSGSNWKSASVAKPKVNVTRAGARAGVHSLGEEYYQLDISMWTTIWMLYIVEFANWDSQAMIGYGCGNNSSVQNTGASDSMPYHTGTMQSSKTTYGVGVQYRNIEDPWGNVFDWCDGITFNSSSIYCFDNFSQYADSYSSTGAKLVGTRPTSSNYIKNWGLSSQTGYEWFMYPSEVQSAQTEVPDYCYYGSSGVVLFVGGNYVQSAYRGLFYLGGDSGTSDSSGYIGVRLQRRPSN